MLKKIVNKEKLLDCVALLKKKKFTPGFDGMSMEGAGSWLYINGERLCRDVLAGDYKPMPATGFRTAKHSGGYRCITRLTDIDTVLKNVLLQELSPDAEAVFSESSFAYRPGKGVTVALERYVALANQNRLVTKFDFQACFDQIPGFEKSRCIMVGDSLSSDILGGINAGITTCWVNPDHKASREDIRIDYEIEALSQLEALLEHL